MDCPTFTFEVADIVATISLDRPDALNSFVDVFADYCRTELQAIRVEGGEVTDHAAFPVEVPRPTSFGIDGHGELVVLSHAGVVYRITG
jgi:hypothetical protein